ncbi:hypothetical protein GCM10009815_15710 [Nocardioides marmoribigeumensis]
MRIVVSSRSGRPGMDRLGEEETTGPRVPGAPDTRPVVVPDRIGTGVGRAPAGQASPTARPASSRATGTRNAEQET